MSYKAEAFDTMQYFYRATHDPLVRCFVRLDGRIDEAALTRAVVLSAKAAPLIFCRFCVDGGRPRWVQSGCTAADAVLVRQASGDLEEPLNLLAALTVDIFRGPQLKILIVRSEEADTLCIVISHLLCDGGGFRDYLYLLCRLYNACKADPAYDEELKPAPRGMRQLFSRLPLSMKGKILFSKDELGRHKDSPVLGLQGDDRAPFISARTISEQDFSAARARAKALGATVNDMLLAAYMRALARETGLRRITIPCPVDLRKYLPEGQTRVCNLSSNLICGVDITPSEPFEETLKKVAGEMARQKESVSCLKGPMLYSLIYPFLRFRWLERHFEKFYTIPVTSYTNLGMLDPRLFRFDGTEIKDAFLTASIKLAPYFQVTASTYGGHCTLTSNLYGTRRDRELISRFLDSMVRELYGEGEQA